MSTDDESWNGFWGQIASLKVAISKSKAVNVNSTATREAARRVVQHYFRSTRLELARLGLDDATLASLDEPLQNLLRFANGRNRRDSYRKAVRSVENLRTGLEIEREKLVGSADDRSQRQMQESGVERQIVQTLELMIPSAAMSYQQVIRDLREHTRLSYRGAAAELREALREVLDHLAPDDVVKESPGFRLEKNAVKPTMRQKARFILKSRGLSSTALASPEDSVNRVEEAAASLARSVYNRGSVATHLATTREEVLQLKLYTDSVLAELVQAHASAHRS